MLTIGSSFSGLSLDEILSNIDYYADTLEKRKVIGFRGIDLSIDEHHVLINALAFRRWDNTSRGKGKESVSGHGETFSVYTKNNDKSRGVEGYIIPARSHHQIEKEFIVGDEEEFFKWSVHIDTPQNPDKPSDILQSYTSMHMHLFKYPESVGRTKFLSLVDLYKKCPANYKEKLLHKKVREYKNNGTLHLGTWDALIKHPVTDEKMLFWPSWYVGLDDGDEPWFDELVEWTRGYMSNKDNWFFWSWKENDFVMFDNRALVHSFEGGWVSENRVFSQGGIGSGKLIPLEAI